MRETCVEEIGLAKIEDTNLVERMPVDIAIYAHEFLGFSIDCSAIVHSFIGPM